MQDFATRLIRADSYGAGSSLPAAVFGSAGEMAQVIELNQPPFRIGVWPIQSADNPETAMGIAAVIAFLLERWQGVRVYRLFARVEGEPTEYQWKLADSQFDVDDWQLDGLDENAAVWGTLERTAAVWKLNIEVENDLVEEAESLRTFEMTVEHTSQLVANLSKLVEDVMRFVGAEQPRILAPVYTLEESNSEALERLLREAFHWELKLYLTLWGQPWPETELRAAHERLLQAGKPLGSFGGWLVANLSARALLPAFETWSETAIALAQRVTETFAEHIAPIVIVATALFRAGRVQESYDVLETALGAHSADAMGWLALAELYRRGGRVVEAIETFQEAIDTEVADEALYLRYADLLLVMDYEGWSLEEVVLIDPEKLESDLLIWEAVEAYQEVLNRQPDHAEALTQQLLQLVDLQETQRLWQGFKRLVVLDKEGERVRSVAEALSNVDMDIAPGQKILRAVLAEQPERYDLHLNLAVMSLAGEDSATAKSALNKAQSLTDDPDVQTTIERLMLAADDPDFEGRLGELVDIVSAGNTLSVEDVDFLEAAIQKAPRFAEGYALLGKAYLAWEEAGTALDTLLDAQKQLPDDPDILELLAQVLWDAGEQKLAFDYLNKGLAVHPNHVPLLALTGRLLFEDEQTEAAKLYLARAEAIAPRHPALNAARVAIAKRIEEQGS